MWLLVVLLEVFPEMWWLEVFPEMWWPDVLREMWLLELSVVVHPGVLCVVVVVASCSSIG